MVQIICNGIVMLTTGLKKNCFFKSSRFTTKILSALITECILSICKWHNYTMCLKKEKKYVLIIIQLQKVIRKSCSECSKICLFKKSDLINIYFLTEKWSKSYTMDQMKFICSFTKKCFLRKL